MATNRQRDARPPRATPKLHDSDVRVVSWKGMSLQQFSSTAPLFESILGPLNDGFILIKPEERILSLSLPIYVSRRYASLVGADPLELRDVPCFSMLKLNEPCEGCLGIDALESRQPMSADMAFGFQLRRGLFRADFIPIELRDSEVFLKVISRMGDSEQNDLERIARTRRLAMIGLLSAGIAHQFNNLLSVILSTSSMIEADPGRDKSSLFRTLETSVTQCALLCKDMMRPASSGGEPELERVDSVVAASVRLAQTYMKGSEAKDRGISIVCGPIRPDLHAYMVSVDVQGAILNIIINAAKHGFSAGESGIVLVRASEDEKRAYIEIENDGRMIPYEVRESLLERPITSPLSDNGLGLFTSAQSIREFGGDITFTSEPGETIFRISLPAKPPGNGPDSRIRIVPDK